MDGMEDQDLEGDPVGVAISRQAIKTIADGMRDGDSANSRLILWAELGRIRGTKMFYSRAVVARAIAELEYAASEEALAAKDQLEELLLQAREQDRMQRNAR
jgi:hypothetical protein